MTFKKALILAALAAVLCPQAAHASYVGDMQRNLVRGTKNVLTFPLEIPVTVQKYHRGSGYAGVRHVTGLFDGIFRAVSRFGSGAWDILPASIVPGIQDGLPVDPETLA